MKEGVVYIDFNIFIELEKNNSLDFFKKLKDNNLILVFSPAHVEEIFINKLHYNKDDGFIKDKLNYLSKITNDLCLLPYRQPNKTIIKNMGVFLYKERPSETYLRVSKNRGEDNKVSENNQKSELQNAEKITSELGFCPKIQNNKNPKDFLDKYKDELIGKLNDYIFSMTLVSIFLESHRVFLNYLPDKKIEELNFLYLKNFFPVYELCIEKLFLKLEQSAFYSEKSDNNINALHDVTHAIYGSYCSYFITNDKKLYAKSRAIYDWLGCPCKVLGYQDFMDMQNKP